MVRLALWLCLLASAAPAAGLTSTAATALSPAASALSPTAMVLSPSVQASADLLPLPPAPTPPLKTENSAWESFAGVTLLSAPFTSFWAVLGALAVEGFAQGQFPPDFGQDRAKATLSTAAAVAGGGSLLIGLVSLHWGGSHAAPASLSPSAQSAPASLTSSVRTQP